MHGSKLAFLDSISANGLINGGAGGDDRRANCHFFAKDWRNCPPEEFIYPEPFTDPQQVPHKPRADVMLSISLTLIL